MPHGTVPELNTARLRLRAWRDEDQAPFAALNADPQVNAYLLGPFTRERSDAQIASFKDHFATEGFGRWAVELRETARFVGTVGLSRVPYPAHFAPAVEIAWRLAPAFWGQGFASEAARATLAFGFEQASLQEIVATTVPANRRSKAVMERIGMVRHPTDDFDHPLVPAGHRLRRHVLYRLARETWAASRR